MPYNTKKVGPFVPQFGRKPESFIGRKALVDELIEGFYTRNSPLRTTIISGVRGSGKTALLTDIADELKKDKDWIIITTSFSEQLLDNILSQLEEKISRSKFQLKGLSFSLAGLSLALEKKETVNFQVTLISIVEQLSAQGIGLVFVVDEIKTSSQMREFAATYQLLVREDLDVVLLMAGLPQLVMSVLTDDVLTFLQRSHRLFLQNIDPYSLKLEYQRVFSEASRNFTEEALNAAYLSTYGYPYLYQLLGYYLWLSPDKIIDPQAVEQALARSKPLLFQNVYTLSWRDLSQGEKLYLLALAQTGESAKAAEISQARKRTTTALSKYRHSLINRGLIESPDYGVVKFSLPLLREFILEQHQFGYI